MALTLTSMPLVTFLVLINGIDDGINTCLEGTLMALTKRSHFWWWHQRLRELFIDAISSMALACRCHSLDVNATDKHTNTINGINSSGDGTDKWLTATDRFSLDQLTFSVSGPIHLWGSSLSGDSWSAAWRQELYAVQELETSWLRSPFLSLRYWTPNANEVL
jgi:hypothetical protein